MAISKGLFQPNAGVYRERCGQLRQKASAANDLSLRDLLVALADDYERLAQSAEQRLSLSTLVPAK